jgi:hypothetical protein
MDFFFFVLVYVTPAQRLWEPFSYIRATIRTVIFWHLAMEPRNFAVNEMILEQALRPAFPVFTCS